MPVTFVVFGNLGRYVFRAEKEIDHPDCYQCTVGKPASGMVWGCVRARGMGHLHICDGTIRAERSIQLLEQHMRPPKLRLFQGDNAKPHSAQMCVWGIMKRKIRQRKPQTVQQEKSSIKQEWERISSTKLQQLESSVPRRLLSVVGRNFSNFIGTCCRIKFKMSEYLGEKKPNKCHQFEH